MKLVILGDICPTDDTENYFVNGLVHEYASNLHEILSTADYVIANLEYVATDYPVAALKSGPVLHYPSSSIDFIKKLGVTHLSLANNHIKDCGSDGVVESLKHCSNKGIVTFGAGSGVKEAKQPIYIESEGLTVCIVAFSEHEFNAAYEDEAGAAIFDPFEDLDYIQSLKESADYLIVLYHGGVEYHKYPSPLLQKKCRKMADKGADYVICQHSHVVGSNEAYNGSTIIYGQGNSVYGHRKGNFDWNTGLLLELDFDVNGSTPVSLTYSVLEAREGKLIVQDNPQSNEVLKGYFSRSEYINDVEFIRYQWKKFCDNKKSLYYPQLFGLGKNYNRLNRLSNNFIVDLFYSKDNKMLTKNIIRCESHNEVVLTLLDEVEK